MKTNNKKMVVEERIKNYIFEKPYPRYNYKIVRRIVLNFLYIIPVPSHRYPVEKRKEINYNGNNTFALKLRNFYLTVTNYHRCFN